MILIKATIKYKGYDPNELKPKSNKRICVSCDSCGKVRWISKCYYKNLCGSCSKSGENNGFYGKRHSKETKKNHSEFMSNRYVGNKNSNYGNHKLMGENNPMYGLKGKDHPASQTIGKLNSSYGKFGKDSHAWKGGFDYSRSHLMYVKGCIKLNDRFKGSEGHHIMSNIVIFIPKNLHKSIYHRFKDGHNMKEINKLALEYLVGDY